MGFWSWMNNTPSSPADNPGDPHGVQLEGEQIAARALPNVWPNSWDGWPTEWTPPNWQNMGINRLIDTAWDAIDLNSSVIASMPLYRLQYGEIIDSLPWMTNPDQNIYASWHEFCKQLMWDYHLGEAFVLRMSSYSGINGSRGYPQTFRIVPPWLINVEMVGASRYYSLGGQDVTADILHVRYQTTTDDAHGHGPLEVAGHRLVASKLLHRYAEKVISTGGIPLYWVGVQRQLKKTEAVDLLEQWVETRTRHAGEPAILSGGAELHDTKSMSAREMTLLELSQFNESRIAIALGVPPFLMGLPSGGDSMTYANQEQIFGFHFRASLRPKIDAVMSALSGWALPRGQTVEVNSDWYTQPSLKDRFDAYKAGIEARFLRPEEARSMERLHGPAAASALSGVGEAAP